MAERKPFLLRIDRHVLDAVQRWANEDLRSLNGQIEFLLRDAIRRAGRARPHAESPHAEQAITPADGPTDIPVGDSTPDDL